MDRFSTPWKLLAAAAALVAAGLVFDRPQARAADAPEETVGWRVDRPAPVKATVGEVVTVPVSIKVLPGHYIYREKTKFLGGGETADAAAANAKLVGDVTAWPATTKHFDKFQNREVEIYEEGTHTFPVPITPAAAGELSITLDVKSQACTHEFCLFPHTDHVTVAITAAAATKAKPTPTKRAEASPAATVAAVTPAASPAATVAAIASPTASAPRAALGTPSAGTLPPASLGSVFSDEAAMANLIRDRFLFALLIAFVGGLGISLTPCVYPMVPITISVIGAHSQDSRGKGFLLSLVYVAGICLVYSGLALVAGLSSKEFGFLLQSPWIRLGITGVFVGLAASMFGAFHLE
ncbi:MAG TPA: protein-disulfide reductase DsbD domain-containing protein, partial [bacterium]|nr:protein-disulfide reductase DsbD domain-containing protein [bacterium]